MLCTLVRGTVVNIWSDCIIKSEDAKKVVRQRVAAVCPAADYLPLGRYRGNILTPAAHKAASARGLKATRSGSARGGVVVPEFGG